MLGTSGGRRSAGWRDARLRLGGAVVSLPSAGALERRPGHKPGTLGTTRLLFSESRSRRRGCPQAKGRAAERRLGRLREHEAETMTTARTRFAWAGCAPGGYGLCGPSASTGRPRPCPFDLYMAASPRGPTPSLLAAPSLA